ncbi:MAG: acyl-CoA dehydratase activase [Promethearchaeota archaeon]|jgi:predicted CoA-substrate-specific enzyme activase
MLKESAYTTKSSKLRYFEGLEIGAVSVKWIRRTQNGEIQSEVIRHEGSPKEKIKEIFSRYDGDYTSNIIITGQATSSFLNLPYVSEVECLEKALSYYNIKPDILLSLGGETFSVYPMKNGIIKNIISTTKCAAGTGEFIIQQLQRMGMTIEEGIKASLNGEYTQLATRCSVHCKSDATHKLNKGECKPEDIAKTLIHDLADKVSKMIESAQWPTELIVISGGVASNKIFIKNLQEFLPSSEIKVLPESPYLEVFGASLYASELQENYSPREMWFKDSSVEFERQKPLKNAESLLDYRVNKNTQGEINEGDSYILGIDAGSTTTKAVLFNISDDSVGASVYLRTLGNPILATKQCIKGLLDQVGNKNVKIVQCGVTGSAREMVSVYLDNCRSFNEILAHARAAVEELPDVDTVFEIGGQDSKFISFLKGVPIDYAMNEGCSAGTGSFLEESASVDMGISVIEISNVAMKSLEPISFGERCAAFINTDLRNALQQGAKQEDVVAGLVYSIAENYISRIIGPRQVGQNLLFLGGVALNRSVALAMAAHLQQKVIVPAHPELMGSVGTALMARDLLKEGVISKRKFNLNNLVTGEIELRKTFRCMSCENSCEIQNIDIRGKVYPFGGVCSKYRLLRQKGKKLKEGQDLVAFRNKMMFEEFGARNRDNPRGIIGLPMALTVYTLFPLYVKFINELGFNVEISKGSNEDATNALASICYPCELIHREVDYLIKCDVDYIFIPREIEYKIPDGLLHGYTCPSTTTIADVIRAQFEHISNKILSPHVGTSNHLIKATLKEFGRVAVKVGLNFEDGMKAGQKALNHNYNFWEKYREEGKIKLKKLIKEPSVIIAGRPYVVYPPEVNIALPRKIVSRGYNAIPADMLYMLSDADHIYERNVWSYTQQIDNAVQYVKSNPNLYICLVSCFSCGPDGTMYHKFRHDLAGYTFCYLEIDSHTAHAGFETRVGAFLDIIEERRPKKVEKVPLLIE